MLQLPFLMKNKVFHVIILIDLHKIYLSIVVTFCDFIQVWLNNLKIFPCNLYIYIYKFIKF